MNLAAIPVGVGDGRAEHNTVEPGPQRIGHAHRARLASGVHRVSRESQSLQLFASQPNSAQFGVRRGVGLCESIVGGAHQPGACLRVDNQRAERDRARRFHRSRGKGNDFAHALFINGIYSGAERGIDRHIEF